MRFVASFREISVSRIVNWLIISIVVFTHFNLRYWNDSSRVIAWDAISYYAYLPATFIYHDPTLQFVDQTPEEVKSKIWYTPTPIGGRVIKTSMGLAMLYAPFFFVGHAGAYLTGYTPDGYTVPYRFALVVSCVFYLALALFFLRKTLSLFFSSTIVSITTIAIVLGTNLFYYSTTEPTMSHAFNFCMFAAFVYLSINWYDNPTFKKSVLLGLLTGLISLARPTNILVVLFFLLWDIQSFSDLKDRVSYFLGKLKLLLLITACCFVVWVPQLLYWKAVSGQWMYFSYGEEGFFFSDPQLIKGLFGYRKGWLLYTPLMLFALAGIPLLYKYCKSFFLPILIFTVFNVYIILSWWSWWYGGGFGLRAFIDSYALLAIPLALFIQKASNDKLYRKVLTYSLISLLTVFSIFQTQQYRYGSIHWDSMSKRAYWATFLKLNKPDNFESLLEPPDYEKAMKGER